MTSRDLSAELIDAIHEQRLGEFAATLPVDVKPAQAALRACRAIAADLERCGADVVGRLAAAGVPAQFDPDAIPHPQYHELRLVVAGAHRDRAVAALRAEGFGHPKLADPDAWAALLRDRDAVVLKRTDENDTRLRLCWDATRRGLLRRLAGALRPRPRPPALGGFLATPAPLLAPLLEFAAVTERDTVLDLGCGDGRVLVAAAQKTGCRGLGVEHDGELCARAERAITDAGLSDHVEIVHGDAESADLAGVTVAILFVPVARLAALLPELRRRLPAGARIVAHEQDRLVGGPPPDRSAPLIADRAITVAHLWSA